MPVPRRINEIILHCSDSKSGNAEIIDGWHRKRGFKKIGYHYIVLRDGTVEEGRELQEIGAHVKGRNRNSIGICIIGRLLFTKEEAMTPAQRTSLMNLLYRLKELYPTAIISGHYEHARGQKTCPNFCMSELRKRFAKFKPRVSLT